jgi:Ham1 family
MSKSLIFATTNQSKVNRLSMMLGVNGPELLTLTNFSNMNIYEPIENGDSEAENALIKCIYYKENLKTTRPVLSQDDGIYTPSLPVHLQAGKDIKMTIEANMGEFNRYNTIQYWQMLSQNYPQAQCNITIAFCLYEESPIIYKSVISCRFKTNNSKIEDLLDGDLLSPFIELRIDSQYKCGADFSPQDHYYFGQQYFPELIKKIQTIT